MDNKRMNVVKLEVKYSTHNSLLYKHGLCDVLHRLCKSEHVLIYCIILQLYMMFYMNEALMKNDLKWWPQTLLL